MNIEELLKKHLAAFNTAPFLFVGSGMSRRYLKLETWGDLLKKFSEKTQYAYPYYYTSENGNYPLIATAIAKEFHKIWWHDPIFESNRKTYIDFCKNEESALKIEIAHYMKDKSINVDETLSEEVELFRHITIDGIITTNWDFFLEGIFSDFKTYIGQSELLFSVPQGIGEIYKIHGCCSAPDSLVLTYKDYKNFQDRNPYLAAKLLTIFTEHPIIFLGYSLSDENVVNIIKSITNCLTTSNIEKLRDRLIFVKFDLNIESEYMERTSLLVDTFQIPITTFYIKGYTGIYRALGDLKRKFPAKLLRKLKEHVYELVVKEKNGGRLYVTDINEASEKDEVDIVFGVGAIDRIKAIGYKSVSRADILEDLVFNKDLYDSSRLVEETLPVFQSNTMIPIFKYLRNGGYIDDRHNVVINNSRLEDNSKYERILNRANLIIEKGVEFFYPTEAVAKKRREFIGRKQTLQEYIDQYSIREFLKYFALFDEEYYQTKQVEEILINNFDITQQKEKSTFDYTQFIKLICLYDYLKYYRDYLK